MHWFIITVVYRIICGDGAHTAQFDEQYRLIQAHDVERAIEKGKLLGAAESDEFLNDRMQLVKWEFVDVAEIYQLHEANDGAEIFSKVREVANADAYASFVHDKAKHLLSNSLTC